MAKCRYCDSEIVWIERRPYEPGGVRHDKHLCEARAVQQARDATPGGPAEKGAAARETRAGIRERRQRMGRDRSRRSR